MISIDKALEIVSQAAFLKETEKILLHHCVGRILAEDIFSDVEMPPFDKSSYDGFACKQQDFKISDTFRIIEIIPAGKMPEKIINNGQCSKIMTGAPVPIGADCIVPVEDCIEKENGNIQVLKMPNKSNIAKKAEDVTIGQKVLSKGIVLQAKQVAVLASMGYAELLVFQKVKVGVLSTGSELVEPDCKPSGSQIRNSNGHQIFAQLIEINCEPDYIGIVEDDETITRQTIEDALNRNDVLLLTGGVSMGDFDFIPDILKDLDFTILFNRIAVQPGKPSTFSIKENKIIFGLPGNPVSSFTIFEMLAKPMLFKMMGHNYQPKNINLPLAETYTRKKTERLSLIPVNINSKGEVEPIEYHGSAHIHALSFADGFIAIEIGKAQVNAQELVHVRLF